MCENAKTPMTYVVSKTVRRHLTGLLTMPSLPNKGRLHSKRPALESPSLKEKAFATAAPTTTAVVVLDRELRPGCIRRRLWDKLRTITIQNARCTKCFSHP